MAHETKYIKIENLLLDEQNPRLPSSVQRKQNSMLLYLARTTSIEEIMSAIAENGYFPGEPLIVIPENSTSKKYIVVEGNRRLTALKLLLNPSLYSKGHTVQEIAKTAKHQPDTVPCVIFKYRDDVINYLGYRHITGVKQWDSLSKARYIGFYFDEHTNKKSSATARYKEVAKAIGSKTNYIKRQLDGLAIYNVLEEKDFFNIDGLDEETIPFSLLDTALGYEAILNFASKGADIYKNPTKINTKNARLLTEWLFKADKEGKTKLGDSRNIQDLAVVVADKKALKRFTEGDSLEKAYSLTHGISEDFTTILAEIENGLSRAVSMISLIDVDEGQVERIDNINKQAKSLKNISDSNRE